MRSVISIVSLLAVAGAASAAEIVIDSFENPFESEDFITSAGNNINAISPRSGLEVGGVFLAGSSQVGDPNPGATQRGQETQSQAGLSGVLGGARVGDLRAAGAGPWGSPVTVGLFTGWPGPNDSLLSFSTAFGTVATLDLVYGADTDLNADFSILVQAAFEFEVLSSDGDNSNPPRTLPVTVELVSGAGTSSASATLSGEGTVSIPFDDFAGVDWSDIDRITLTLDQAAGDAAAIDFAIGPFKAVGELIPTPGALALAGVAGLGAVRRRRG